MNVRPLLFIGAGVAFISLTSFVSKKKAQVARIIDALQFRVVGIKNIKISFQHIALDVAIQAVNPTKEDLRVNTGFIAASVLRVYEKKRHKLLAFSNLNTHAINIPRGGFYSLPTVHLKIPLLTGGELVFNQLMNNQKKGSEDFLQELTFEVDLKALGQTRTLKF